MTTTLTEKQTSTIITPAELLSHWQGHRGLTRKLIEVFPEKELFEYSLGGMRSLAGMLQELLAIAAPGLREIITGNAKKLNEHIEAANSKANILRLWDEATEEINLYWAQIREERFHDEVVTFGQFKGTVWSSIFYFIDNEIHHRAQGYVFLRTLGIEPPPFWAR